MISISFDERAQCAALRAARSDMRREEASCMRKKQCAAGLCERATGTFVVAAIPIARVRPLPATQPAKRRKRPKLL